MSMSPKRPPRIAPVPVAREWRPEDTQTLERRIDIAQEVEWRRGVVDQMTGMAKTLGEVRDTSRSNESTLQIKASKTELGELAGEVKLLTERVSTLKHVTWGVLVVFLITVLLEKKGIL